MPFSRPLFMGCFVLLLLLIATVNGKDNKKRHHNHPPKCKSYRPPKNAGGGQHRAKRLAGGTDGDIEAMPWMVYLRTSYQFPGVPRLNIPPQVRFANCTGTLISPRYVLTVAHCLPTYRMMDNNTVSLYYGAANWTEGRRIVRDKYAVHIHPNFTSFFNSGIFVESKGLAVVDLGQDLEFDDNVHSICLVCLNDSYPQGEGIIAGWGDIHDACNNNNNITSVYPEVFRYANQSFHPCLTPNYNGADMVCSQADSTHGVGGGDSGGPFIAPVGPSGDYMQVCVNGANNCNPRENACTKIYGDWLEEVTGVRCKSYEAPCE